MSDDQQDQQPAPAVAPPPAAAASPAGATNKKSPLPMIIGAVVGVVLLVAGYGLFGPPALWSALFGTDAKLAKNLPKETAFMMEVPDVRALALSSMDIGYLNQDKLDKEKSLDEVAGHFATAFEMSPDDAKDLVMGIRGVGFAATALEPKPEAGLILSFGDKGAVEKLLGSPRFTAGPAVGSGTSYTIKSGDMAKAKDLPGPMSFLVMASVDDNKGKLVWFDSAKALVAGETPFVEKVAKVIDGDAPPMTESSTYGTGKGLFIDNPDLVAFVDTNLLKKEMAKQDDGKKALDWFFQSDEPMTISAKLTKAGMKTRITMGLAGKLVKKELIPSVVKRTLHEKLPASTFAYLSYGGKSELDGAALEKLLMEQMAEIEPRAKKETEQGLAQMKELLGVSFPELVDAFGNEGILAVAAAPDVDFKSARRPDVAMQKLGVMMAVKLEKPETLEKVIAAGRQKAEEAGGGQVKITAEGKGFRASSPSGQGPTVVVKFVDDLLVAVGGGSALIDEMLNAVEKGGELHKDKGYSRVMSELPKAHSTLWVDTGRVLDVVIKGTPSITAMAKLADVDIDVVHRTGENRISSAYAVTATATDSGVRYQVDMVNGLSLFAVGGISQAAQIGSLLGGGPDPSILAARTDPMAGMGMPNGDPSALATSDKAMDDVKGDDVCARQARCCILVTKTTAERFGKTDTLEKGIAGCKQAAKFMKPEQCETTIKAYMGSAQALGVTCD